MKIRHIKIERFRGIRELDWRVGGDFVCLMGPARMLRECSCTIRP